MRAGRPAAIAAALVGLLATATFAQTAASAGLNAGASSVAPGTASCDQGTFAGVEANGVALCVHADDGALTPALALPSSLPGIPCYGGSAPRVHVYYAYKATNNLAAQRTQLRDVVAQVDAVYNQSAKVTGGIRHVRWVMSPGCSLVITPVKVTSTASYDVEAAFRTVLSSGTLGRHDHALIFLDYNFGGGVCGYGSLRADTRPGSDNISNVYQGTAEVANGACRDATSAAHELGHTLGAVQADAPHHSYNSHCYDGLSDVMCYDDGAIPAPMRAGNCPAGSASSLDCGNDDYYNTNPAKGSYLDTHWNVARSVLLARTEPTSYDAVANPTVRITNVPANATFVGAGDYTDRVPTTVAVDAAGGTIKRVEYYLDDTQYLPYATSAPWSGTPVRSMLDSPGWHSLYAIVRMTDGRSRTSPVVRVRLLADPVLTSPAGDRSVTGTVPLSVTLPAGTPPVGRIDYSVDFAVAATATAAPFTASVDTTTLDSGSHEFGATVYGTDGKKLADIAPVGVYVANDGAKLALRTSAAAGAVVSGTVPVSATISALATGRSVTGVTFSGDDGSVHAGTPSSDGHTFSYAWHTCTDQFGCAAGSVATITAQITFNDDTTAALTRAFVHGAPVQPAAIVRIPAGTRLHAGTTITVPFMFGHVSGAQAYSVQVFTKRGYLGQVFPASGSTRSVRVRVPSSWRGADAVWVRVSSSVGSLFSAHVPVTWVS